MKNFKNLLVAVALMAASVIAQPAFAGDKTDAILDVVSAVVNGPNNGYGERWQCRTTSRGYVFRAEGRSYDEANYNVVNLCMNHPYGAYSECRYQVSCQQIGSSYPYPQPQPRLYTCQTFGGGKWHAARHQNLRQAQRRAVRQCQSFPYSRPYECERNLRCGY